MSDLASQLFFDSDRLNRAEVLYAPAVVPIFVSTADSTVANKVAEGDLPGTGIGSRTMVADRLIVGSTLRIRARGYLSTDVSPPTLTIRVKFGTTVLLTTGAITITSASDLYWELDAELTCRTIGATGTVMGQGLFAVGISPQYGMVNTAAITIDTTVSQTINLTAQWSAAEATATITCTNVVIEILN